MESISLTGIMIRFLLGGGAVCACTIISQKAGSNVGGIFAAFPAVFIAALLTLGLDAKGSELIQQSIILSQGAFVGMFINIFCAIAVVYFCTKKGWKQGLTQALIGWFIVSIRFAVITAYF